MTWKLACLAFTVAAVASSRAAPAGAATPAPLRRFALVIGSNTGTTAHDQLRYADHDAATVADVLEQLGGVNKADLSLLDDPDGAAVDHAFDALSTRARSERVAGQRVELLVYYSGHSDETGILLAGAHYDYAHLRDRIRGVPADVHIAIVDSCESGSFTRAKGGTRLPPFLHDSANQVEGFAFLSSSSATEDAQESDRIGASFFTYFFVSALRGAADANHDGVITLSEAYQFSYEHTLGRTQNTLHGPQHPSYDMHLSGTGDVVMTDLRATASSLILPAALAGHVAIVDAGGRIAVELTKEAGQPLSIALPDGAYTVYVDNAHDLAAAAVSLNHVALALDMTTLAPASREDARARGIELDAEHAGDDHRDRDAPWYRQIAAGFGGGLRLEVPSTSTSFDSLVTLGGIDREVHGAPVVGIAESTEIAIGATLGGKTGFAYDLALGFGPGVFVGDNLQLGATIGFGFDGITDDILGFAWKVPTEVFAVLELSKDIRPMAYFRQNYIFGNKARDNGTTWGVLGADESEVGAGLRFSGKLDGFVYGSVREMEHVQYWGIGFGAML